MSALEPPVAFGDHELLARLGSGRNSEVFLALRPEHPRVVALKRLRPDSRAEAEIAERIEHPRVVRTYQHGEIDGVRYVVMEYLAGRPLGALIRAHGALPPSSVAHVGADIADGLHAVHQLRGETGEPLGLVHLDVSPSNIQVSYDGRATLLDLGLARAAGAATARGKIGYLAPEQVRRERADARADVFALGIVLWEALTGKRLFRRGSRAETYAAITGPPPPPPSSRGVPADLDAVVARALAGDRAERFGSAAELATALREHITGDARAATGALMREHFDAERVATEALIERALGRGRWRALSIGIGLLVVAALIALLSSCL